MKFVDVKNDVAIHKIFGNRHKPGALLSLLNALLGLEGLERAVDVAIEARHLYPPVPEGRASIMVIRSTDQEGRETVLELLVGDRLGFEKRFRYYDNARYAAQVQQGDKCPWPRKFLCILDDEGLRTAYHDAERHYWGKADLILYNDSKVQETDIVQRELFLIEKQMEMGDERGRKMGELKMILSMHRAGIGIPQIVAISHRTDGGGEGNHRGGRVGIPLSSSPPTAKPPLQSLSPLLRYPPSGAP